MWTVFFDDFCLFSEPALERSSDIAARSLFDLLGWAYDTSGEKNTVFGRTLHALGVVVNLPYLTKGSLLVSNTEARVKELVSEISDIIRQGRISRSKARHMAGRMSFASGQMFGRLSKSCLKAFCSVLERSSTELLSRNRGGPQHVCRDCPTRSCEDYQPWPKAVCLCVH